MSELSFAIEGFNEQKKTSDNKYLESVRLICFYSVVTHAPKSAGIKKPEDLFELPGDKESRRARIKKMKPIQKIDEKW